MKRSVLLLLLACLALGSLSRAESAWLFVTEAARAYQAKDYDLAVTQYQKAIKLEPSHAGAFQGLGNCFLAKGDRERALVYYRFSLQLNPANPALASYVEKLTNTAPEAAPQGEAAKYFQYGQT